MKVNKGKVFSWLIALLWIVCSVWLLVQPIDSLSDNEIATKERGSTHGWVYNTKTKTLQFCIQTSGEQYDANAEVMCIPYPKKVKIIDEFDSFFLDNNEGYLPYE